MWDSIVCRAHCLRSCLRCCLDLAESAEVPSALMDSVLWGPSGTEVTRSYSTVATLWDSPRAGAQLEERLRRHCSTVRIKKLTHWYRYHTHTVHTLT